MLAPALVVALLVVTASAAPTNDAKHVKKSEAQKAKGKPRVGVTNSTWLTVATMNAGDLKKAIKKGSVRKADKALGVLGGVARSRRPRCDSPALP